jgi:hypothetical protein
MAFPYDVKEMWNKAFRQSGSNTSIAVTSDTGLPVELVESIAQQIIKASDRNKSFTWLDFGTRNERVSSIIYTAPSVGAYLLTKNFTYSLSGNAYRLDSESLVLTGA